MSPDVILIIQQPINEADGRTAGRRNYSSAGDSGPGVYPGMYDWRVWDAAGFGRQLQRALSTEPGYAAEITDFGQYVSARVSYHNVATGKAVSKTFVIAFESPKWGDGKVYASSTKWRTISNISQAAQYIKSYISSCSNQTSNA